MPVGGGKTEPKKKRSQKKKPLKQKQKTKSKQQNVTTNPPKQDDLNKPPPEDLSTLRWDCELTDPILENDRIEQYKELRRQRYINARQQAIQNFVEKTKITKSK